MTGLLNLHPTSLESRNFSSQPFHSMVIYLFKKEKKLLKVAEKFEKCLEGDLKLHEPFRSENKIQYTQLTHTLEEAFAFC